jgi:hypothetical protein
MTGDIWYNDTYRCAREEGRIAGYLGWRRSCWAHRQEFLGPGSQTIIRSYSPSNPRSAYKFDEVVQWSPVVKGADGTELEVQTVIGEQVHRSFY